MGINQALLLRVINLYLKKILNLKWVDTILLSLKSHFKKFRNNNGCSSSGIAMAFENRKDDVYGFQFHPDSFLTTNGKLLIKKIISA